MAKLPAGQLAQVLIFAIFATSCGGGGSDGGTPPTTTTTIAKAAGDAQQGTVGQPLLDPLIVVVTEDGAPSAGATVAWSTSAGSGSVNPTSVATDANGTASTDWTLGTASGAQSATATLSGAAGSPVTFTATGETAAAAAIAKAGGDGQTAEISSQLGLPVQARVTDQFANAVQGVAVAWAATGGTVSSPSVTTNASGLSSVNVTAGGAEGPIVITAAADGLTGSPLTFNATAVVTPPPPATIAITVGNDFFRSDRNQTTGPAVDTVAVGGTVTWTWVAGAIPHNVTSNPPPGFSSSPTQAAGTTHAVNFPTAGTYRYYCNIHAGAASTGGMIGRIVVR
ncbi:MAG TPA: Ig-like domain-containing protein [Gemmatimonadales bacterium]|nr:Ig-like domain-containing protein [Gemmatimonadales bacterium]